MNNSFRAFHFRGLQAGLGMVKTLCHRGLTVMFGTRRAVAQASALVC
jgi:hypothetical protein